MKIETPILKRLGPVPFWRGERRCLDALEEAYRKAMESARTALYGAPQRHSPASPTRTCMSGPETGRRRS